MVSEKEIDELNRPHILLFVAGRTWTSRVGRVNVDLENMTDETWEKALRDLLEQLKKHPRIKNKLYENGRSIRSK